jgi:Astacin (Peptidase family M12A)
MSNCVRDTDLRWPGGEVPYLISSKLSAAEQTAVEAAIAVWNSSGTGVSFVEYKGPTGPLAVQAYAVFVRGDSDSSCRTTVGRRRPGQRIFCHLGVSTLVHEMGHTLGLKHEQQRFDRDLHVAILRDNVIADKRGNFDRLAIDEAIPVGLYDFDSTMHYGEQSFAVDFEVNAEIPNRTSRVAPAALIQGGRLHVVHTDDDKRLFHTRTRDLVEWVRTARIENQSTGAPSSLAEFDDELVLVHIGETSTQVFISRRTSTGFTANQKVPGISSRDVPALAAHDGELHMAFIGATDNEIRHTRSPTGRADDWEAPRKIGQTSKAAPALASDGTRLHLVHLGNSSPEIWHSTTDNGRDWTANVKIGQQSKDTPALAVFGGTLHLAHLGESSNQTWHATFNAGTNKFRANKQTNQFAKRRPALAAGDLPGGSLLALSHIGDSSSRLYTSRYNPDLRTIVAIDGHTGNIGGDTLTAGDLAGVRFMYG